MGLLKDLKTGKMSIQSLDGATPTTYNSTDPDKSTLVNELTSNAGLNPVSLTDSTLDLGTQPPKYLDNLPK